MSSPPTICKSIAKSTGKRCTKRAESGSKFCWMHSSAAAATKKSSPKAAAKASSPKQSSPTKSSSGRIPVYAIDSSVADHIAKHGAFVTLRCDGNTAYYVQFDSLYVKIAPESECDNCRCSLPVKISNVESIWVGCGSGDNPFDDSEPHHNGNSALLIKKGGKECIVVGGYGVDSFKLLKDEKVIKYFSTVGDRDFPNGFIETTKRYIGVSSINCRNGQILKSKLKEDVELKNLMCMDPDVQKEVKPLKTTAILR